MLKMLNEATANGDSDVASVNANRAPGGFVSFVASGTWDGATITMKFSPDGGTTWVAIPDAAFTQDTIKNCSLPFGVIKATVSSAGDDTELNLWLSVPHAEQ